MVVLLQSKGELPHLIKQFGRGLVGFIRVLWPLYIQLVLLLVDPNSNRNNRSNNHSHSDNRANNYSTAITTNNKKKDNNNNNNNRTNFDKCLWDFDLRAPPYQLASSLEGRSPEIKNDIEKILKFWKNKTNKITPITSSLRTPFLSPFSAFSQQGE